MLEMSKQTLNQEGPAMVIYFSLLFMPSMPHPRNPMGNAQANKSSEQTPCNKFKSKLQLISSSQQECAWFHRPIHELSSDLE